MRNLIIALVIACAVAGTATGLCIHFARRNALTHEAYRELSDTEAEIRRISGRNKRLADERGREIDELRELAGRRLEIIAERDRVIEQLRTEQRRTDEYIDGLEQYRDDRERNDRAIEAVILDIAGRNNIDSPD